MALIDWSDKYSVDNPSIDTQHKKLIEIINEFHEAMKSGKGKEQIQLSLSKLLDYTKTHFGFEEKMMQSKQYPDVNIHLKEHAIIINKISDYQEKIKNGENVSSMEMMDFMKNWLFIHIQSFDKKLGKYLIGK